MAKVLLVNPPFYRLLGSKYNANSLGIAYIASYLNKRGHDAWLYNADYVSDTGYIKIKKIFSNFNSYKDYFRDQDNAIWHEVKDNILRFKPDWVGYTSYTANISAIKIISEHVKKANPSIKQVVGGVHATLDSDILKTLTSIDYSIQREGEEAFTALVENKNPKLIPGVVSRDTGGILIKTGIAPVIKNIDTLPMPEREKFWNIPENEKKTRRFVYEKKTSRRKKKFNDLQFSFFYHVSLLMVSNMFPQDNVSEASLKVDSSHSLSSI